ncbi:MAG: sigma-70 family RNA polymerase sigma factor [Blastocatellales bacterium]
MEFNQSFAPATRNYLFNFAHRRLRDADTAEEVVQDTLLAAFRSGHTFAGKSSERTWLMGTLKHKIADYLRSARRERSLFEPEAGKILNADLFDQHGRWQAPPTEWNDPWQAFAQKEFQAVLRRALDSLPARQAQVFWLREMEDMSTAEICKILCLSTTNMMVLLYRARLRLREYLEVHWFGLERIEKTRGE